MGTIKLSSGRRRLLMERCLRGLKGTFAKRLWLTTTEGSNPSLSALVLPLKILDKPLSLCYTMFISVFLALVLISSHHCFDLIISWADKYTDNGSIAQPGRATAF